MPYAVLDDLMYLYARRRLTLADCWKIVCCRHPEHDAEQPHTADVTVAVVTRAAADAARYAAQHNDYDD